MYEPLWNYFYPNFSSDIKLTPPPQNSGWFLWVPAIKCVGRTYSPCTWGYLFLCTCSSMSGTRRGRIHAKVNNIGSCRALAWTPLMTSMMAKHIGKCLATWHRHAWRLDILLVGSGHFLFLIDLNRLAPMQSCSAKDSRAQTHINRKGRQDPKSLGNRWQIVNLSMVWEA